MVVDAVAFLIDSEDQAVAENRRKLAINHLDSSLRREAT
jgi:hypothetical protein